MVQTHPLTGKKALYGICLERGDMMAVEGVENEEARQLLRSLLQHAEGVQGGFYAHPWQVNDLLMWDSLRVHHRGANDFPLGEPRLHHKFLLQSIKQGEDNSPSFAEVKYEGRRVG